MVDPIHLQDLFSKTQLTERVSQIHKENPETAQRQFNLEIQKKIEDDKSKPKELNPKDEMKISSEDKRKDFQQQKKKEKKEEKKEEKKSDENAEQSLLSERHIDIKI